MCGCHTIAAHVHVKVIVNPQRLAEVANFQGDVERDGDKIVVQHKVGQEVAKPREVWTREEYRARCSAVADNVRVVNVPAQLTKSSIAVAPSSHGQ